MVFTSLFIYMQLAQSIHLLKDALIKSISVTSYFMASISRLSLIGLVFIMINLFYLLAAVQAHQDPRILLDLEYQGGLHDSFLILVMTFYIAFLFIFLIPLMNQIYQAYGYKSSIK